MPHRNRPHGTREGSTWRESSRKIYRESWKKEEEERFPLPLTGWLKLLYNIPDFSRIYPHLRISKRLFDRTRLVDPCEKYRRYVRRVKTKVFDQQDYSRKRKKEPFPSYRLSSLLVFLLTPPPTLFCLTFLYKRRNKVSRNEKRRLWNNIFSVSLLASAPFISCPYHQSPRLKYLYPRSRRKIADQD